MTFLEQAFGIIYPPVLENEPLKKHSTIGIGGRAKYFAIPKSLYSLKLLVEGAKKARKRFVIIGNASNILFSDSGYNGIVICTKNLSEIFVASGKVKAMAGASLNSLIDFAKKRGLSGLEKLYGIPATIGGAIYMNAGAFGQKIADCVYEVETLKNGKLMKYSKEECRFGYRKSRFQKSKEVILSATFDFEKQEKDLIVALVKNALETRKLLQPQGKSFGCVFTNPQNYNFSAGALIEGVGLKGFSFGGATISEKHANFIINNKNATAKEVVQLINLIKNKVNEKYGVLLNEEVKFIGDFNDSHGRLSHSHKI